MNFERISEKKIKYDNNKSKISSVTLSSYEKDFELRMENKPYTARAEKIDIVII